MATHKEIVDIVVKAVGSTGLDDVSRAELLEDLFKHKPLYDPDHWLKMEPKLSALGAEGAAIEAAEAREDKSLGFKDDAEGRRMAALAREMRESEARVKDMEAPDFM